MKKNKKHKWKYQINIKKKILVTVILGVILFVGLGFAILESNLEITGILEVGQPFVTVTLDSDGGTGSPATKKYLRGTTYGTITEPTKTNYKFLGWNGKNIFNRIEAEDNKSLEWVTGNTLDTPESVTSDYIAVEKGTTYVSKYNMQVILYDANKNYINRYNGTNSDRKIFTIDDNNDGAYVRVSFRKETNDNQNMTLVNDIQLEKGSTVTSYEPYYITTTTDIRNSDHTLTAKWVKQAEFATDDWDTIVRAYKLGATQNLESDLTNGTAREIELDLDHDPTTPVETAHLRIANLSKPSECDNINTMSQTACGFVIEFTDIIAVHGMNPFDSNYFNSHNSTPKFAQGAYGGWEYSDMRAFLNGTIYQQGESDEIDYTGVGIIDALPTNLKKKIIDTTVISGHSSLESSDFITTDKLYLLSPREMYGTLFTDSNDTAHGRQRQLDYYIDNCPGDGNCPASIRGDIVVGHYPWYWYRSASFQYKSNFYSSNGTGSVSTASSNDTGGVTPAFRIAN